VKAVGQNRDRAGKIPERDLGDRDDQIECEDAAENADDGSVAISGFQFRMRKSKCKDGLRTQNEVKVFDLHPGDANPIEFAFAF
jgi:hypothetical protein